MPSPSPNAGTFSYNVPIGLTIAGVHGRRGYHDGPSHHALFGSPTGLAIDSSLGAIYVADWANHCIRSILNGKVTTCAGNGTKGHVDGPALMAQFNTPCSLAIDNVGGLVILECNGHRIRRLYRGYVETIAGTGSKGFQDGHALTSQFRFPRGIAIDPLTGDIYISDSGNDRVRKLSWKSNQVTTIAGGGTHHAHGAYTSSLTSAYHHISVTHAATFCSPRGIAVIPSNGNIIVADYGNNMVRCISNDIVSTIFGISQSCHKPYGVAINPRTGMIYLAESGNNRIRCISSISTTSFSSSPTNTVFGDGLRECENVRFNFPLGVAVDRETSDLLITDMDNYRICRFLFCSKSRPLSLMYLLNQSVQATMILKYKHIKLTVPSTQRTYLIPYCILSVRCPPLVEQPSILTKILTCTTPATIDAFLVYLLSDTLPMYWPVCAYTTHSDNISSRITSSRPPKSSTIERSSYNALDQMVLAHLELWAGLWAIALWTKLTDLATFCPSVIMNQLSMVTNVHLALHFLSSVISLDHPLIVNKCILFLSRKPKLFVHHFNLILDLVEQYPHIGSNLFDMLCMQRPLPMIVRTLNLPPKKLGLDLAKLLNTSLANNSNESNLKGTKPNLTPADRDGSYDFVIQVGNTPIHCHTSVLFARWPYFRRMINSEMSESNTGVLNITPTHQIDASSIKALIYYLYTGSVQKIVSPKDCLALLNTLDYYALSPVDIPIEEFNWLRHHLQSFCKNAISSQKVSGIEMI